MSQVEEHKQFVQLLMQSQRSLYGFIFALVPVSQDAEDILQETNAALLQESDRFQLGTDFLAWARTVARFKIFDHRKRKRRVPRAFDESLLEVLCEDLERRDSRSETIFSALEHCRTKLTGKQRDLIDARYSVPSVRLHELAVRFNMTPEVISQTLYRIRRALFDCIQLRVQAEGQST